MSKETNIAELKQKVEKFSFIISELEKNQGYNELIKFWKEEVQSLDDTWQFIPEENSKARMEARATKMAYLHLFSILDYLKADIQNTNKIISVLNVCL